MKEKWNVTLDEDGKITFPPDLWQQLRRATGVRSKKHRIIKKRIKLLVNKALLALIESQGKEDAGKD